MNTKNAGYGTVLTMPTGKFQVNFWNPFTQSRVYIGLKDTREEAQKLLNEYCFDFYSRNSWLLPKCISLNRTHKKYRFALPLTRRTVSMGDYETLQEAVDAKMAFINKLLV